MEEIDKDLDRPQVEKAVAVRLCVNNVTQPLWIWTRVLAGMVRVSHSHQYLHNSQSKVFGSINMRVAHTNAGEPVHARTKYITNAH